MKSTPSQNLRSQRILAVHGFTGEPYDFAPLYESGSLEVDWRFVTLPGHERELKMPIADGDDWQLFCVRIGEIVDEASRDGVRLIGLGYSMGARLLLRAQLEKQWDFDRMILIGVTPGLVEEADRSQRWKQDESLAKMIKQEGISAFLEKWKKLPIIATQLKDQGAAGAERWRRKGLLNADALAKALLDYSNGKLSPVWDDLRTVETPVHLVAGEFDSKFLEIHQRMALLLRRCSSHTIPGAGHAPHLENVPLFLEFLGEIVK